MTITVIEFGCGTVFRVSETGKETVLYSFCSHCSEGDLPYASLIQDVEVGTSMALLSTVATRSGAQADASVRQRTSY
jgi:hypothetical protein